MHPAAMGLFISGIILALISLVAGGWVVIPFILTGMIVGWLITRVVSWLLG